MSEKKVYGAAADPTKRFQPGVSGNPKGRAKGIETIARAFLNGRTYTDSKGIEHKGADALLCFLWEIAEDKKANDRDRVVAIREFFDRSFGKAQQNVSITDSATDDEDESDLEGLSIDELRVLAKVRAARDGTVH